MIPIIFVADSNKIITAKRKKNHIHTAWSCFEAKTEKQSEQTGKIEAKQQFVVACVYASSVYFLLIVQILHNKLIKQLYIVFEIFRVSNQLNIFRFHFFFSIRTNRCFKLHKHTHSEVIHVCMRTPVSVDILQARKIVWFQFNLSSQFRTQPLLLYGK